MFESNSSQKYKVQKMYRNKFVLLLYVISVSFVVVWFLFVLFEERGFEIMEKCVMGNGVHVQGKTDNLNTGSPGNIFNADDKIFPLAHKMTVKP